jgi:hypothetical protein
MPCGALILVAKEPVSAAGVELPEWSNRAVSKNVVPLTGTEGSNPPPSTGESANPRSLSRRTIRAAQRKTADGLFGRDAGFGNEVLIVASESGGGPGRHRCGQISERTFRRWRDRLRDEGPGGLSSFRV